MPCIYSIVSINNCTQLYKFIQNTTTNYTLKVYYKNNNTGRYVLQKNLSKNINPTTTANIDSIINSIRLNKTLPQL